MPDFDITTLPSGCLLAQSKTKLQYVNNGHQRKAHSIQSQAVIQAYYKINLPGPWHTITLCWNERCVHPWHRIPKSAASQCDQANLDRAAWRDARRALLKIQHPQIRWAFDPRIAALPRAALESASAQSGCSHLALFLAWAEFVKEDYRNQRHAHTGADNRSQPLSTWIAETKPERLKLMPNPAWITRPSDDWTTPFLCGLEGAVLSINEKEPASKS